MIALSEHETPPYPTRPMRADARRNYERLLAQARVAFAESGADASLDEIARRAGVASGTLYRHFPTRGDLIEAVLAEQITRLVDLGERLLTHTDAFDAVSRWMSAVVTHGLTYRGLAATVMTSAIDRDDDLVSTWHARIFDVGARLLQRARRGGHISAEATDTEILKLTGAIALAAQDSPDATAHAARLLTVVLNGLRHSP